jgi:hypothetical protein
MAVFIQPIINFMQERKTTPFGEAREVLLEALWDADIVYPFAKYTGLRSIDS